MGRTDQSSLGRHGQRRASGSRTPPWLWLCPPSPRARRKVIARFSESGCHAQVLGEPVPLRLIPPRVAVAASCEDAQRLAGDAGEEPGTPLRRLVPLGRAVQARGPEISGRFPGTPRCPSTRPRPSRQLAHPVVERNRVRGRSARNHGGPAAGARRTGAARQDAAGRSAGFTASRAPDQPMAPLESEQRAGRRGCTDAADHGVSGISPVVMWAAVRVAGGVRGSSAAGACRRSWSGGQGPHERGPWSGRGAERVRSPL